MAKGVGPGWWQGKLKFLSVASVGRRRQTLLAPDRATDGSESIGEGGLRFGVPRCRCDLPPLTRCEPGGEQGDDGEQGEQAGGRTSDGLAGPLTLGLNAEMGTRFLDT